jgi:hypothetical protein
MDFIASYKKSYDNSDKFQIRYEVFRHNYQLIVNHNLDEAKHGFSLAVNQFADLTLEEFSETRLGLKGSLRPERYNIRRLSELDRGSAYADIPKSVDWRVNGTFVNAVKDQGSCGSSWSFSTIGSIESAFAIKTGQLSTLSEQQLVQCSKVFGNRGCSGGFMEYAFRYSEKHPLCTESEYPYEAKDSSACSHERCLNNPYKLEGFQDLEEQSRLALYTGISQQPVSIGV